MSLAAVLAYAVAQAGATAPRDRLLCLLALAGLWLLAGRSRRPLPTALPRLLLASAGLVVSCAVLQLVPLPLWLVEQLSPARAEMHRALQPVMALGSFASLSVLPSATLDQMMWLIGCLSVALFVRSRCLQSPQACWRAAIPIIALGGLEGALGCWQRQASGPGAGAHGTYVNPNHFAGLLEMALPFAVAAVAVSWSEGAASQTRRCWPLWTALATGGGALILLGILASYSRAGFVATLASLLAMTLLAVVGRSVSARQRWRAAALGLGVLTGTLTLAPADLIEGFGRLASVEGLAADGRLALWRDTWSLVRTYPLLGCGWGAYEPAFLEFKSSALMYTDDFAHNDYLQLLAEAGIVGFLGVTVFVAAPLGGAIQRARRAEPAAERWIALACVGSLTAILLHSVVDFNLYIPANRLLFAWVLGIAAGLAAQGDRSAADSPRPYRDAWGRPGATAVSAVNQSDSADDTPAGGSDVASVAETTDCLGARRYGRTG